MSKIDIHFSLSFVSDEKTGSWERLMDQMNISITEHLAGFVRGKVASGRYNNASEVVRDALRRMEDEDLVAAELAESSAEELLSRLSPAQIAEIRVKVLEGIEDIEEGRYRVYEGEEGLAQFAAEVKARGRGLLKSRAKSREAALAKAAG